ncbi:MAG: hypothetical protein WC775_06220 [Patescibacteria group bacterium]|jgi:hypothetical protein
MEKIKIVWMAVNFAGESIDVEGAAHSLISHGREFASRKSAQRFAEKTGAADVEAFIRGTEGGVYRYGRIAWEENG